MPQRKTAQQMAVFFSQKTRDGSETPVLVRLVELGSRDTGFLKAGTDQLKMRLVAGCQSDVRRVFVGRTTEEIGVFNGGVASLNCLLREWEIAVRDCVKVRLLDLQFHGELQLVDLNDLNC